MMNSPIEENHECGSHSSSDDFSLTPVPDSCTKSSWHIALIVIGTVMGIPIFLVSAQIGGALGLANAIPAFLVGGLVLCLLGCLTSMAGAVSRYSTYMLVEFAFGRSGAKFVNFVIALTLIGWFGVNGNVFGQAADLAVGQGLEISLPIFIYVIIGSALMIWISIVGFQGIDRLAFVLVPLMILFMAYTNVLTLDQLPGWDVSVDFASKMSFSSAASAVIGSYIVGAVIQPDYSRFARNVRHSVWAIVISLGVGLPSVLILAAIPSVATGEVNLIQIMIALGIGVPAFLLLLLGTWSSNVVGLYSSGLSLATIFTRTRLSKITFVAGIMGTALALSHVQVYFIPFLVSLGIVVPPIAAIYVIDVLVVRRSRCDPVALKQEPAVNLAAFTSWVLASFLGFLASQEIIIISGIAALDTVIVASVAYLLCRLKPIHAVWVRTA